MAGETEMVHIPYDGILHAVCEILGFRKNHYNEVKRLHATLFLHIHPHNSVYENYVDGHPVVHAAGGENEFSLLQS